MGYCLIIDQWVRNVLLFSLFRTQVYAYIVLHIYVVTFLTFKDFAPFTKDFWKEWHISWKHKYELQELGKKLGVTSLKLLPCLLLKTAFF